MFTVQESKKNFFDRRAVIDRVGKAGVKNLSKWGAFVRTDARSSLRYRKRPGIPGQPPSVHKTMQRTRTSRSGVTKRQAVSPLKEFLFFALDPSTNTVVAGPARLNGKLGRAPEVLEHGGTSEVRTTVWENHRRVASTRTVPVAARPFMGPAAARTNQKLPEIWADSIRK